MNDHDYHIGDLVSYCGRPAMVTFVKQPYSVADIICLDDYIVMNVGIQHLHYLGPVNSTCARHMPSPEH